MLSFKDEISSLAETRTIISDIIYALEEAGGKEDEIEKLYDADDQILEVMMNLNS